HLESLVYYDNNYEDHSINNTCATRRKNSALITLGNLNNGANSDVMKVCEERATGICE
ncbi:14287_t:CDS:1, partial [Acaulospora colombiana]